MPPNYAVLTTFNGKDNVSHLFRQMSRSAESFGRDGKQAMRGVAQGADHASTALRNASKHGYNFGAIVKGILAANAIRGGLGYITGGLQNIGQSYLEFGDTMVGATARFNEVDLKSKAFGDNVTALGHKVRSATLATRYNAASGAAALNELAKANYNSGQAAGIMPNMLALATVAQEDLAAATKMSSDILGAFDLKSQDVAVQLTNHRRLNDQLAQATLMSTGNFQDLFETLKTIGPISKSMKQTTEATIAMAIALDNAGLKGDVAATSLKRAQLNMFASKMRPELEKNGVFPYDLKTGKPRHIMAVIADLGRALGKLRDDQRIPLIQEIFGVYGLAGTLKLMEQVQNIAKYEERIKGAKGTLDALSEAMDTSLYAKTLKVGNAIFEKGFQILDKYAGKSGKGLDGLFKAINDFDIEPITRMLSAAGKVIGTVYQIAKPFLPMLPYLAAGFATWAWVLKPIGAALAAVVHALPAFGGGLAIMEGALAGGALATALWGIAAPILAIGANLLIIRTALDSLQTGKDNWISRAAQWAGLVPKLAHDSEGRVIGHASDQLPGWNWVRSGEEAKAPNAKEADARAKTWKAYLEFGNVPEGSKLNGHPLGKPAWEFGPMGANP